MPEQHSKFGDRQLVKRRRLSRLGQQSPDLGPQIDLDEADAEASDEELGPTPVDNIPPSSVETEVDTSNPIIGTPSPAQEATSPISGRHLSLTSAVQASPTPSSIYQKENLPALLEHELEFLIKDPKSFPQGKSIHSPIHSLHGSFRFRLLVFPMGSEGGANGTLSAFVEAVPPKGSEEHRWAYEQVKFQISLVNWKDYRKTATQNDTFNFSRESTDRGWHKGFGKTSGFTVENGWLSPNNEICLRASCCSKRPMLQFSTRKAKGYAGLKNHGATCYMNCLLQTLFCLGHFRHVAYTIDMPEAEQTQAVVSSDDALDSCSDDRPAQPLLISLQNLFYRLQTSDVPVSCRELMRSFGWDTADAFMQHDAQELNRLLCDRLEEQMKGTSTDGEIKRLFEGEFENYIECVDVEYRSQRDETFYDLQLNLRNEAGKDITSLEDSLRDFTNEEMLEGENAYDAGAEHGKQRARKGIRFKRFPPVLYIQLKRFMFDAERMDMCKLNGKLEFPQILDLEAFAAGSGKYHLHTVIVHSGGVSSGHYYAFVRIRDCDGKSQWMKFDDEQVSTCSEEAAVQDNYGGEDLNTWDYFKMSPREIREANLPTVPRIHNAYMLSYVRVDQEEALLTPPVLDGEDKKYKHLLDRCEREARLAEERRLARLERLNQIEVRIVLESNVMQMQGWWGGLPELTPFKTQKVSRDMHIQDFCLEVSKLLGVVSEPHIALFLLQTRKTRQVRFETVRPNITLRSLIPAQGSPHTSISDQHLIFLALTSRCFDPLTFALDPGTPDIDDVPSEISRWNNDLLMLVVKYFCPTKRLIVTLGCHYCLKTNLVKDILGPKETWLKQRLQLHLDSGVVAPLPCDFNSVEWLCYEEYGRKPQELPLLNLDSTLDDAKLCTGDILVWQPVPSTLTQAPKSADGGDEGDVKQNVPLEDKDNDDSFIPSLKEFMELQQNQMQVTVRLFNAEALWCPEGIPATGSWSSPMPLPGTLTNEDVSENGSPSLPGEVACNQLTVDVRWSVASFMSKMAKVFGVKDTIAAGGRFWLFDRGGVPSACPDSAVYRSEAEAPAQANTLMDYLPRTATYGGSQRWVLNTVIFPPPPSTELPLQPVVVHFFDDAVAEVGACVLYVPILQTEDGNGANGFTVQGNSGRPAISPAEVLALARQHLSSPGGSALGQKMRRRKSSMETDAGDELPFPPLRLVDADRGRIRAVYRSTTPAEDSEIFWPACGDNLLFNALRVEPDFEAEEDMAVNTTTTAEGQPISETSEPEASQLAEVLYLDQVTYSPEPFGHPFLVRVRTGDTSKAIQRAVQAKIAVDANDLRQCRFLLIPGEHYPSCRKYHDLPDGSEWPLRNASRHTGWRPTEHAFAIERPRSVFNARNAPQKLPAHKPLTIK